MKKSRYTEVCFSEPILVVVAKSREQATALIKNYRSHRGDSLRSRDASSDSPQTDLGQTRIEFGHVRELFVL